MLATGCDERSWYQWLQPFKDGKAFAHKHNGSFNFIAGYICGTVLHDNHYLELNNQQCHLEALK